MANWYKIKISKFNQLLENRMSHKKIEKEAARKLDKDAAKYKREEKKSKGEKKEHLKKEFREAKKEATHLKKVSKGRD